MAEEHTPLSVALSQLKLASKKLNLDSGLQKMLSHPKRSIIVSMDIRMDDGGVGVFNGMRVQHWDARGPFKGGIRYYPNITLDDVTALYADDLEMRHCRHPVWWSQRRRLRGQQKTKPA